VYGIRIHEFKSVLALAQTIMIYDEIVSHTSRTSIAKHNKYILATESLKTQFFLTTDILILLLLIVLPLLSLTGRCYQS